jgi:hypothetical protein
MIQFLFSLRYQTQIRRTRPELYDSLEKSITGAIGASGGILGMEHRCIAASFDENAIGFWLDMLTLLETVNRSLEGASSELFGYVCLLAPDLEDYGISLCHTLPAGGTGIWCGSPVQRALGTYVDFEKISIESVKFPQRADFARLRQFKSRGISRGDSMESVITFSSDAYSSGRVRRIWVW